VIRYLFMNLLSYLSIRRLLLSCVFMSSSLNVIALTTECPDVASSNARLNTSASIVGFASDPRDGTFLYCEYYYPDKLNSRQLLVEYRDINQTLIAKKKLSYKNNLLQPQVRQEDLRHGELRQVLFSTHNTGIPIIEIQYKQPNAEEESKVSVDISDSLVIDAGFDEAVRKNWAQLLRGKIIKIDFLSPVHLKTFNLSILRTENERFMIPVEGVNKEEVSFVIRPSNHFISLFAKPLLLTYDKNNKRLLAYNGNVNITDKEGKTMEATIRYYYRY